MIRVQIEPGSDKGMLKTAARTVHPDGIEVEVTSVNPQLIVTPLSRLDEVVFAFRYLKERVPWPGHDDETLYFDIETHGVEHRWNMPPREFFRLGQYAWGVHGEVHLTTDYDEMLSLIRRAYGVVGHNIHSFDLSVLFGKDSTEPLVMSLADRVFDTMTYANQVNPAPYTYTNRTGHTFNDAAKPAQALKWLSLDNQCYQLGVGGKEGDLKALAKEFDGFGNIPVDDERFVAYAIQDVVSLQDLCAQLLSIRVPDDYSWREQKSDAINAQSSRNGFTVNTVAAQARVDELAVKKAELLDFLVSEYGFPTEGKMPWRSKAGKEAIFKILADHGITPNTHPHWTRTATGNFSLGGDALVELTAETALEELGQSLAQLQGQRALAQLALDCVQDDGKVHPDITALQRSGRRSTLKPGLTVWSARGAKAVEKEYFVASPGRKLVEMDYSAADNRAVAALAADARFMERFAEGADAHEITGRMMFGNQKYDSDPKKYRTMAKPVTHGGAYGAGAKKLAATTGLPVETTQRYLLAMAQRYPQVHAWKSRVATEGERGYVVNSWGRKMIVDPDRSYTQSPAMYGQSTTTEIFKDGLLRVAVRDIRVIQWLVACVHDAAVWDIPESELGWAVPMIRECMETTFDPPGGMAVQFPMSAGDPSDNWMEASHE